MQSIHVPEKVERVIYGVGVGQSSWLSWWDFELRGNPGSLLQEMPGRPLSYWVCLRWLYGYIYIYITCAHTHTSLRRPILLQRSKIWYGLLWLLWRYNCWAKVYTHWKWNGAGPAFVLPSCAVDGGFPGKQVARPRGCSVGSLRRGEALPFTISQQKKTQSH